MTAGRVGDDAAMRAAALVGLRSGKSMREIAVDLYGADRVPADWHGDSWMIPLVPIKSTSYGADQQIWGGDVGGIH